MRPKQPIIIRASRFCELAFQSHAKQLWIFVCILAFGPVQLAFSRKYGFVDASEAAAEAAILGYAGTAGHQELVDGINSGEINVYFGQVEGDTGASTPGENGGPDTIIIDYDSSSDTGQIAIHEFEHLISGDPHPPSSSSDLTDAEWHALSCAECSAICNSIAGSWIYYLETGLGPSCSFLANADTIATDACNVCALGPGGVGPPPADPCGAAGLPCTN